MRIGVGSEVMSVLSEWKKTLSSLGSFCTLRLPWMKIYRGDSDIVRMHRLALDLLWGRKPSLKRRVKMTLNGVFWPVVCLIPILLQLKRLGPVCAEQYGISLLSQALRMWKGALIYGLEPAEFYNFRSLIKGDLSDALFYFQGRQHIALLEWMNRDVDTTVASDKLEFFRFCQTHDLPTIPVFAVLKPDGEIEYLIDPSKEQDLLRQDLFFKPTNLYRGFGTESFVYDGTANAWRDGEGVFTFEEICASMNARYRENTYLIQPHIRNAREWAPLTTGALATVRLVTYHDLDSTIGCLAARMAVPYIESSIHDHFALAVGVDVETGVLGQLMHEIFDETKPADLVSYSPFDTHPTTGSRVTGERLHGWDEIREVCLRGHRNLPEFPFIGWDAAMTDEGPVIVEANSKWGHTSSQVAEGVPLGRTVYPSCYMKHLDAKHRKER